MSLIPLTEYASHYEKGHIMNKSNNNLTHANRELQDNPTNVTDTTQEYKKNNSQSRLGLLSKKLNLYLLVQYK